MLTMSAQPSARIFSATSGALMRLVVQSGMPTSLFIFFVTQAKAARGTDVAIVGTRRSTEYGNDVAETLAQATLQHTLPQGLRLFLRAGWGPLLTQRLLRHGRPSAPWQDGLNRLDQLLDAISSDATRVREFESLLATISAELLEAGLRGDRCDRLQQALREAFYERRTDTTAIGEATPTAAPQGAARLPGSGVIELPES